MMLRLPRKSWIPFVLVVSSMADVSLGVPPGVRDPLGDRRVIYNSDLSNTTCHLSEAGATEDELREVVRNYAAVGAIDTLVQEIWHQGWSTFWRTEKCPYDSRFQHERLLPLLNQGVAPVEIYIDECHRQGMEFFAGFRMNDRHGHNPEFFEELNRQHPDWILTGYKPTSRSADPRSRELGCALNYAQEEVREFLFAIVEEAANRFDVDGIEFNFTRMPDCFPRGQAEESHEHMTRFVRKIRRMLDETGRRKGRKLEFGVRVLQHVEGCRKMGLDVARWISEELIDYVAPGDVGFTDFNAKYEEFVELARPAGCRVYPQVEARVGYHRRTPYHTLSQYRAAVTNIFGAGADGFSTQNFQYHWGPRFSAPGDAGVQVPAMYPQAMQMLKQLRDPDLLKTGSRHYVFAPLWGPDGIDPTGTYMPERIELKRAAPGPRGEFRFRLCESVASWATDEEPRVTLAFWPTIGPEDVISVDVNGEVISGVDIEYHWPDDPRQPVHCECLLDPALLRYGDNVLGMRLIKSAAESEGDIVLHEVEVHVDVSEP